MIYMFLAEGFEECEALTPLDILRRAEIEIKTVGIGSDFITGSHGITVKTDLREEDIILNGCLDAVILPGGMPGTINLEKCETVRSAISFASQNEKLICAICAAPKILGGMDLLRNKKATCFPGFEDELQGALISADLVVKDGNIITAKGAGAAADFGFKILSCFKGESVAEELRKQMQFK